MRRFLFLSKNLFFLISFIVFFGSFYFYLDFKEVIQKHEQEIHNIEIKRAYKTAKSILPQIQEYADKTIASLVDYPAMSFEISRILSYYRNDEFKYIYLIYIDEHGSYRYLADGSEIEEKATPNQKFTPSMLPLWDKLKKEKKDVYDIQDNAEGLWLTYLAPVVTDGKIDVISNKNKLPDDVIKGKKGYYVIRFKDRKQPPAAEFAGKKKNIAERLLQQKQYQTFNAWVAQLESKSEISIEDGFLD